mmetsp:Transcript_19604/g.30712  ORF Transcript_19604/g.30712 Transcript_19604/m.30712 type:complete len:542 (-) Transcript_19604:191-1816(-)|eukprot:CAMPEP_0184323846 /NCGR_PEP_ID=MMETSP1049-20130417/132398_1 /TAXON_ID=77928 /ORGANISM="Proteomonas sulcata, Strain CCMP704" /LENGTH=541 /DNA_ID=CAMNT_0026645457 /DNA_START=533 /DNA_END=2158 /DNA_ORIENTATION=+
MKRSFSLSELQNAINEDPSTSGNLAGDLGGHGAQTVRAAGMLSASGTLKKSVSMGQLDNLVDEDSETESEKLPSLAALGLSLPSQAHGYEELKRGRGVRGRLPTSSSSGSLTSLVSPSQGAMDGPANSPSHLELPASSKLAREAKPLQLAGGGKGNDEDTRGAASALLDLFGQKETAKAGFGDLHASRTPGHGSPLHKANAAAAHSPAAKPQMMGSPVSSTGVSSHSMVSPPMPDSLPAMVLPPLRDLIAASKPGSNPNHAPGPGTSSPGGGPAQGPAPTHVQIQSTSNEAPGSGAPAGEKNYFTFTARKEEDKSESMGALASPGTPSGDANDLDSPAGAASDADAKHNKYCHFCQHVKVKRVTSMLACENAECARRFCEHCLVTHLQNVHPPDGKSLNDTIDGKWLCPICRKVCCCAIQVCNRQHRHCKAYRYRQRRAEQAAKRTLASAEPRTVMERRPIEMQQAMPPHPMMAPGHMMRHPAAFGVGPMNQMHPQMQGVPGVPGVPADINASAALQFMLANGGYLPPQAHPQLMFARNGP